jgi:hypothetical protein
MISAYRTGLVAGSTVSRQHPELPLEKQKFAAQEEVIKREKLGVAHLIPEEDFIKGFLAGYRTSTLLPDGLTLYSKQ